MRAPLKGRRASSGRAVYRVVETTKGTFAFETIPARRRRRLRTWWRWFGAVFTTANGFTVPSLGSSCSWAIRGRAISKTEADWGRGRAASSGKPIGAAEIIEEAAAQEGRRGHGAPRAIRRTADSQIYVTLRGGPDLDGRYAVFGQVIEGDDVPGSCRSATSSRGCTSGRNRGESCVGRLMIGGS